MDPDRVILDMQAIPVLAIGICRTRHGNTHTGVAYRNAKRKLRFFHQAFHHVTRDGDIALESEQMGGPFFSVIPSVEEDRARAIAGFWEFLAGRGEQIGYALRDDPDALFDPNTGILVLSDGKGLSCSTFVLALFRSVRFPLIDTTGWPTDRPGDREAQEQLVLFLQQHCDNVEHVEAVRQEIGCERVRPEEIAGAGLSRKLPVRHAEAEDAGLFIRGGLHILGLQIQE
jgi:hypothetical protein